MSRAKTACRLAAALRPRRLERRPPVRSAGLAGSVGILLSVVLSVVLSDLIGGQPAALGSEPGGSVSFRHEVLPALSKHGCSAGACHGSPNGKDGFRLSLRGFDPEQDRATLLRESGGRRVDRLSPERSLLLLKPTMRIPHGGGKRLRSTDLAYRLLRTWIAEGCRDDPPDAARCVRIVVAPERRELVWPDCDVSVSVRAIFSDGGERDVTPLTVFISSDESVATVDAAGRVACERRGEATIMARYLDFVGTAQLEFRRPVEGLQWEAPPERNWIDAIVFPHLRKLQLPPSPDCEDGEFLRRVFLDVVGALPSRRETEAFLANRSPDKRETLIDDLLEREEFAHFWAQKWADLLRVRASKLGLSGVHKLHRWLIRSVRDNMPYDRFAWQLLTASGSTFANPPANFYRAAGDVNDAAESTAQLFLGIRIQCARCHNHPFDQWSQDNYYGIGAFFGRVQRTRRQGDEHLVWLDDSSEVIQPRTGQPVPPWAPLLGNVEIAANEDRRVALASWLTSPENPFFARVESNRIWGHLLGRGIVAPVDDFRADNPPAHPELLDALARRFIASGYDRKALIREILNSQVYQLSSRSNAWNQEDEKYFSHAIARPLGAERLLDAISQVTGVPEQFGNLPPGTRAAELPSPDFGNDFLTVFGQPARNSVCACERRDEPKLAQTLQLINGPLIPGKLRDSRSRLSESLNDLNARVKAAGAPPAEGLVAWFRADDADSLSRSDGASVGQWINQADRARSAAQSDGGRQPQWIASAIAGLPAVRFDGVDDDLRQAEQRLLAPGAPRTLLIVGRLTEERGGALFTFGQSNRDGAAIFAAQHIRIAGVHYLYSDGVNGAGNTTVEGALLPILRQPFVTTFRSPGAGQKLEVRLNGAPLTTQQPGTVGVDQVSRGFTIGSREDQPTGSQNWKGDIAELLIYDRLLTESQQAEAGAYLAAKYALQTAYPTRSIPRDESSRATNVEIVDQLYLTALCRYPTVAEREVACDHVAQATDRQRGLEDVAWALMNSKEFVFQH